MSWNKYILTQQLLITRSKIAHQDRKNRKNYKSAIHHQQGKRIVDETIYLYHRLTETLRKHLFSLHNYMALIILKSERKVNNQRQWLLHVVGIRHSICSNIIYFKSCSRIVPGPQRLSLLRIHMHLHRFCASLAPLAAAQPMGLRRHGPT